MQREPTLSELDLFVRFVEAGSLAAAARRLGVPTSTVSRAVQRLERSLRTSLVNRSTRANSLTDAGRALFAEASPHLKGLRGLQAAFGEAGAPPRGTLRLTAPVDLGEAFVGQLVARFTARYPSLGVEVDLTSRLVDLVKEGFDVALRAANRLPDDGALVARRVADTEVQLFASPCYLARAGAPQSPEELPEHDCVLFRAVQGKNVWLLEGPGGARAPISVTGRMASNDLAFVRSALRAGAGLGPLPSYFAEECVRSGRLVRVLPEWRRTTGTIYVVYPSARHLPRKVSAFRDFVLESFPGRN